MKRSRIRTDPAKVRAWQDRSRRRLPAQSAKRKAERPTRDAVVAESKERDGGCVMRGLVDGHRCRGPLDAHEVIPRSAWPGGHLVVSNVRMVCRFGHDWIDGHEDEAHELGLHGYSWERPVEEDAAP